MRRHAKEPQNWTHKLCERFYWFQWYFHIEYCKICIPHATYAERTNSRLDTLNAFVEFTVLGVQFAINQNRIVLLWSTAMAEWSSACTLSSGNTNCPCNPGRLLSDFFIVIRISDFGLMITLSTEFSYIAVCGFVCVMLFWLSTVFFRWHNSLIRQSQRNSTTKKFDFYLPCIFLITQSLLIISSSWANKTGNQPHFCCIWTKFIVSRIQLDHLQIRPIHLFYAHGHHFVTNKQKTRTVTHSNTSINTYFS